MRITLKSLVFLHSHMDMVWTRLRFNDLYFLLFAQFSEYLSYVNFYLSIDFLPPIFRRKHDIKIVSLPYIVEVSKSDEHRSPAAVQWFQRFVEVDVALSKSVHPDRNDSLAVGIIEKCHIIILVLTCWAKLSPASDKLQSTYQFLPVFAEILFAVDSSDEIVSGLSLPVLVFHRHPVNCHASYPFIPWYGF